MPEREIVTKELATLLGVLSHPCRIQIVEELRAEERDVQTLQSLLGISQAGVSQHLAILRAHRIVAERREGRHVFYHLCRPEMARWLTEGLRFVEGTPETAQRLRVAVDRVRALWSDPAAAREARPPATGA